MKKKLTALICVLIALSFTLGAFAADIKMETDDVTLDVAAFNNYASADVPADSLEISAPSAILMEKETGKVIFEKNADERLRPASVTKVMTILLIAEEIEAGRLNLEDSVSASTYASGMGGSQIYLKEGETMPVKDMLKSVIVSSANDAAVALAEHIAGSEGEFVARMNKRAKELGMENTLFCNCTGLLEQPDHLTTARDIAIMSRELISHDWIKEYTTIWMDTVRGGEFGLSNTNKLIHYYDGSTGLKTGYTSSAGYCLSATAERSGVEYIAVVMNCKSSQDRFESAKALLNYGFGAYTLVSAAPDEALKPVQVTMGQCEHIQPVILGDKNILVGKTQTGNLVKNVEMQEKISAPVSKGQKIGTYTISDGENVLYTADIVSDEEVERLTGFQVFINLMGYVFCGSAPYGNI